MCLATDSSTWSTGGGREECTAHDNDAPSPFELDSTGFGRIRAATNAGARENGVDGQGEGGEEEEESGTSLAKDGAHAYKPSVVEKENNNKEETETEGEKEEKEEKEYYRED